MQDTQASTVDGALDHLVNQFSDPLSFLRELIQNSIDAGTLEVEVWLEHAPGEDGVGPMIIHVDDFGEGMDRRIIDSRLTRLFSSSKDGDLTKIGRFGIGFASVFAIKPDAVCVDTSKGGESWRILFNANRSFSRIERDLPVEGTKIQIIKTVDQPTFLEFKLRAHEVIRYWCKHVEIDLRFDGKLLSGPLDLDAPITVRSTKSGTTVIAGYTADGSSFQGFYNKGLTLLESDQSHYAGVAFKVSSRYLEHTLTRDNVLRDENYEKAIKIVDRLVREDLVEALFERLEQLTLGEKASVEALSWHQQLLCRLLDSDAHLPPSTTKRAILRSPDGDAATLQELRRAVRDDRLLRADRPSPITRALRDEGYVIIASDFDLAGLSTKFTKDAIEEVSSRFCFPILTDELDELHRWSALVDATRRMLESIGGKIQDVRVGHWSYAANTSATWPAMTQKKAGELTPFEEARQLGLSLLSRKRTVVLNGSHPTLQRLRLLAEHEPELAAYTLVKLFFLGDKLDLDLDLLLTRKALERRCRRQKN